MIINNEFALITAEVVSNLEKSIGLKLPEEYKKFILRNNGGYPTPNKFTFTDLRGQSSDSLVDYFLPVGQDFDSHVGMVYEYFTGEERLPVGVLPIAYDPFGNMICISLVEGNTGAVLFWDHELEFEDSNLSVVANSFEEFINMLH